LNGLLDMVFGRLSQFWYGVSNTIQSVTAVIIIIGGILCILGVMLFSSIVLKKIIRNWAIAVSVVLSCILMFPIISSANNYVKLRVEGTIIDETKAEIRAQNAEAARLRAENQVKALESESLENQNTIERQTIEVQRLNESIKQLESTQLSMQSFQRILELALLETNLKQTMVRKDRIGDVRGLGLLGYNWDEVLVIINHDITAKFGIDLNEVRVARLNENTVVVSGIRSKYIGTSRYMPETILSEMRRVDSQGGILRGGSIDGGAINSVRVYDDRDNIRRAAQLTDEFRTGFQRRLSDGLELGFMDDAVTQLAQNFMRVMLAPLYGNNIRFDNAQRPDALPIMEYLERELRETNALVTELNEANNNLLRANEQLQNEIKAIENSVSMEDGEIL